MPRKGKGKSRGKRRSESLQHRIKYRVTGAYLNRTGKTLAEARAAMLTHFYATGEELLGTHMIIEWRNKNNKNPLHANWKTSDDPGQSLGGPKGAFATLHGSMQRALDFEPEDIPVVKKRGPVVSTEKRSAAMKQYHSDLGKIQAKHPSWPHKKVREEYRKKRGKK